MSLDPACVDDNKIRKCIFKWSKIVLYDYILGSLQEKNFDILRGKSHIFGTASLNFASLGARKIRV